MQNISPRGFTLVEAMIAVTIVTLAVAGPLSTARSALLNAELSSTRLTASYLAQEAIEYVRAMRDDAYLNAYKNGNTDTAWDDFLNGSSAWSVTNCRSNICTLDPSKPMGVGAGTLSLQSYAAGHTPPPLYLLPSGVYTQQSAGATATSFTRTVQVSDLVPPSATEVVVTSTVTWNFHGTVYSITVTDHLTPWQ